MKKDKNRENLYNMPILNMNHTKRVLFYITFAFIVFLGFFLRFYKLGETPDSLNWDEVSWGYNAYSILKTGKDEHGFSYPLSFKAFGDFKQPVYVYLASISVKIFGLNEFAVRFPSAFLGALSIFLIYLLASELFKRNSFNKWFSILSMFFFSISPWSIQFSRVAYEANAGLFFVLLGAWLFIKAANENKKYLFFLGGLFLALSAYTYHSEKIFAPLLIFGLFLATKKTFQKSKKLLVLLIVFYLITNLFWLVDLRTTVRGRSVAFFTNPTVLLEDSVERIIYDEKEGYIPGKFFHNRRFVYVQKYIENYLDYFNPNYLFLGFDNPRHHPPEMGILYLASLPLILIGVYYLLVNKGLLRNIIFYWLLTSPIPAALAIDAPNASRGLTALPIFNIIEGVGLTATISFLLSQRKKILLLPIILTFSMNFFYFFHQYFIHTNTETQKYWQYGYKEAIKTANSYSYNNKNVNIFFLKDIEQAYIFYLFYSKYDPPKYLNDGGSSRLFNTCFLIDNAFFGTCLGMIKKGDLLVVGNQADMNKDYIRVQTISYLDKPPAITIFKKL